MIKSLTLIFFFLIVISCETPPKSSSEKTVTRSKPVELSVGKSGSIIGVVKFVGTPPHMKLLKRQSDPFCGKTSMIDDSVVVNQNGTLRNVVIRITNSIPPKDSSQGQEVIKIAQVDCMYRPRVVGLGPKQKLTIHNMDPVLHNVHCFEGARTCFNQAQTKGGRPINKDLSPGLYRLKCDVHPWMTGYVIKNGNRFVQVVEPDGAFRFVDVPVGNYTVEAWHEKLGSQKAELSVKADEKTRLDFTFSSEN